MNPIIVLTLVIVAGATGFYLGTISEMSPSNLKVAHPKSVPHQHSDGTVTKNDAIREAVEHYNLLCNDVRTVNADSWFTLEPRNFGPEQDFWLLHEYKIAKPLSANEDRMTDVDKLNGVQWRVRLHVEFKASRYYSKSTESWSDWEYAPYRFCSAILEKRRDGQIVNLDMALQWKKNRAPTPEQIPN